jgi:hypothetical protein
VVSGNADCTRHTVRRLDTVTPKDAEGFEAVIAPWYANDEAT